VLDEDDGVKDLAVKSIEELWFPPTSLPSVLKKSAPTTNTHDKTALFSKVSVIMGTAANFKDRQSPLEDVLHKIMADKAGAEKSSLHARYGEICEALIDGLVDASDLPGFVSLIFSAKVPSPNAYFSDRDKLCQNHPSFSFGLSVGSVWD
jgi:cohesin loading factor subunit SCC2